MIKSKALKGGNVISDVRVTYMRYLQTTGVAATLSFLYPKMIAFHALQDDEGFPGPNGRIKVPPLMRGGYSWMEPHGGYLLSESAASAHLSSVVGDGRDRSRWLN